MQATNDIVTRNNEFSWSTSEEIKGLVASIAPDAHASYEAAMTMVINGDFEGARAALHTTVALDPTFVSGWLDLAGQAELFDQSPRAVYYCQRVLEVDPDNPDALQRLAVALLNLDMNAAALEVLERFNRLHNCDGQRGPETFKLQVELTTLIGSESGIDFTKRVDGSDPTRPKQRATPPLRQRPGSPA